MFREILIVARYEIVSMLLGVRSVLLVIGYGVVTATTGAIFFFLDSKSEGQLSTFEKSAHALTPEQKEQALTKLSEVIGRPILEAFLNGDLPLVVIFMLFASAFVTPGLVLLVGYNGLAEDLSTRFARYVLQRVRRESWLIGKMIAHFTVCFAAIVFVHAMLLAYAASSTELDLANTISALPRVWAALILSLLGYVAFTAVFSATISPPFAAFAVGAVALVVLWIASFVPGIGDAWMGNWHIQIWALDPIASGIYAANAIVLGGLAYFGLRRRDV